MKKTTIFTHGSSKENPGPAAIGVFIIDKDNKVLSEVSESIGNATSDYAQYFAVVRGFQTLQEKFGEKTREMNFELKLDSELVKSHLCAEEQIKNVGLIGSFVEIYNMRVASFPKLSITHVSKEQNKEAKRLVSEALDA